jgi:hypothetical protein
LVTHSQCYIKEEMAVFAMESERLPAAEIYPGSNLHAADYLLHKTPAALPPAIRPLACRHFTRIDFDRINVDPAATPLPQKRPGLT